jgi:UDP-N-acetylglucosamine:LPS N-acetylglucosamine transferase
MRRAVLIVSASMGAGHNGAARELARRLEAQGYRTETVDFLHLMPFGSGTLLRKTYEAQLRWFAWTYQISYQTMSAAPALARWTIVTLVNLLARHRLRRHILATRPDAVVSTYPLASLVLGRLRRTGLLRVPVATYLTDFAVHPLWVHPGVDLHLAVSPGSSREAEQRGASTSVASGPLVGERFREAHGSRARTRARLGIQPDARVVLVVSGSLGLGDVPGVLESIRRCGRYHAIVVCGNNDRLRARLADDYLGDTVIGWTDDMPELMGAADVIIENAGGLSAMEAFASGLPVITYRPIAGHGKANAQSMEAGSVTLYARNDAELETALSRATTPGPSREALVAAGHNLFAADPAQHVMELASTTRADSLVVPLRRAPGRRLVAVAVALALTWIGLTEGAEAVSGFGVGVAKPPSHAQHVTYLGVRMTNADLHDPAVLAADRRLDASIVIDARTARQAGSRLAQVAARGVDIANAGAGGSRTLPWNQARADCQAGAVISRQAARPTREFVAPDGPDAFDQLFCRLGSPRQRLVRPDRTVGALSLPREVHARRIYVVDGRGVDPRKLAIALAGFERMAAEAHVRTRPLTELR